MDIGKVQKIDITNELSKSYLDYAMSVIVARALPDIRDGLKPVHRRILYAMHQMGLLGGGYTKSAKVVGEVLGKYHPHGDMAVYDALVRLAQDFSMRYPLIDGQGNFGSVDGDPPAAMRYTEVRLDPISVPILADIEKDTVDFVDNFDATIKEPSYLPALLPNLLLMGSEGIAVGMATKIPPHNLSEVIDSIFILLSKGKILETDKQEEQTDFFIKKISLVAAGQEKGFKEEELNPSEVSFESTAIIEELLSAMPGPDFPTGGAIYDAASLVDLYTTGRGRIVVRGIAEIKEGGKGKTNIVITEIPYQVNKSQLVADIANLVKDKKIVGISNIWDESDKEGMTVVVELKRDAMPKSVLNNLFKHTKLQTTFPANFVALVDGTPFTVNLKQILTEYVKHRQKVVIRRTIFELTAAKKRAHILEGLKIALDNLDAVIKTIRASKTQEDAKQNLITRFGLTDIQATAILDMQLRRLAALEREKIEKEYEEIKRLIDRLTIILRDPKKVLDIIKNELTEIKEKYGDKRKTKIYKHKVGEFTEEDLVAKEDMLITLTKSGYIKRVPRSTYRAQGRGGKGVMGMMTKEEDEIKNIISSSTHDTILFFTDQGRVFSTRVWEIPETSRISKGQALVNLINTKQGEIVQSILSLGKESDGKFLTMVTAKGIIKKTSIKEFENMRASGLIAIKLLSGDKLVKVEMTHGEDNILIFTKMGKSIKFPEKDVRSMGRPTTGVRGIEIEPSDEIISMEVFRSKESAPTDKRKKFFREILTISEKGIGKRTPVSGFPLQHRGGKGVKAAETTDKTGKLAVATMVNQEIEQIVITSKGGQIIRLPIRNVPVLGRATQGVILMRFTDKTDSVAAAASLEKGDEKGEQEIE